MTFSPALGQEAHLESILTEFVQGRQNEGRERRSLWRLVISSEGSTLIVTESFPDLTEFEQVWHETTPASEALVAALQGLLYAPAQFSLSQILVPIPS